MLSALLRPFTGSGHAKDDADLEHDITFRPSVAEYRRHLHATADFTEADDDDDDEEESNDGEQSRRPPPGDRPDEDEDGMARSAGLLPLFSGNHLGANFQVLVADSEDLDGIANHVLTQTLSPSTA
jgi:hypothetical protein